MDSSRRWDLHPHGPDDLNPAFCVAIRIIILIVCVHPALIGRKFFEHMSHPFFGNARWAQCVQVVWFAVKRLGAGLLGCLSFVEKLAITSIYLYVPIREHPEVTWCHTCALFVFNFIVVVKKPSWSPLQNCCSSPPCQWLLR